MPAGKSYLRDWGAAALALVLSLGAVYAAAEAYVSLAVDDGMQFDLEMWRYSKEIKRVAANPAIGHEHTPGTHVRLMGVDVAISSQGLRDRDYPPDPPAGRTRILMLGDSLTLGWGVPQDKTYTKRLENMLRASGRDVDVINTGVGNWNTEMEVAYFLDKGARFKPKYVVLNYFINDPEPTPHYGGNFITEHSRAVVWFASRLDSAMRQLHADHHADWRSYYASLYSKTAMRRVDDAVGRLADYCREHGIKLIIADYPELHNPRHYPFAFVGEKVRSMAQAHHVEYLDLLPAVRDLAPSTLWVTPPDPHPSIAAHEAFAQALFRRFDAELPRPVPGAARPAAF